MTTRYEQIRRLVQVLLANNENVTNAVIAENVGNASKLIAGTEPIDEIALTKELETAFNVWVPLEATLDSYDDHIPWLPERGLDVKWLFWNRYRRFLEEEKHLPPRALERLDEITLKVLERLEDPRRDGSWDRRGMVVGQVQSGKTANYSGLICRAADAGYKLIVVLAGLHNNLRSQTQLRLDEGFLGFDTERNRAFDGANRRVGVGRLKGEPQLIANSLTSSADLGDFNTRVAEQAGIVIGGDPLLLVIKKNKSVLRNLFSWATDIVGERDVRTGKVIVRNVPLLIIDDEADNASVNTQPVVDPETGEAIADADVSQINRLIRQFLNSFEKKAYVGYTATPFANIFIYPDADHPELGDDLFPRSFIFNLPEPTNYVGPIQVFGLEGDLDIGLDPRPPLPVVRRIDDYSAWMPSGHKKDHQPGPMPESLRRAMRSFVLSCAARIARGQEREHMSMLVHVTRFMMVQARIQEQVVEEMKVIRRQLEHNSKDPSSSLNRLLKSEWDQDFVATSDAMGIPLPAWDLVRDSLPRAAIKIGVKTINGVAEDILDYSRHPDGLSAIAIGGDKLSRGLTLEGLSVSYYLRPSKMYDTLMQMGRWFGYRPGYLDLCRLYTTSELVEWYRHVTLASEELRREFDHMAALGKTPREFGLRVRSHPAGLVITAANKMKTGTTMSVSFAGDVTETIQFEHSTAAANLSLTERFVRDLGNAAREDTARPIVWTDVPSATVLAFLAEFQTHPGASKARSPLIAKYIEGQNAIGELATWTVALVSSKAPLELGKERPTHGFGKYTVGLTLRNPSKPTLGGTTTIDRLLDPVHEKLDLDEDEVALALEKTVERWRESPSKSGYRDKVNPPTIPSGGMLRQVRDPKRGLLLLYPVIQVGATPLIGFGVSFPGSENARAVEYVVNNIYWEQFG